MKNEQNSRSQKSLMKNVEQGIRKRGDRFNRRVEGVSSSRKEGEEKNRRVSHRKESEAIYINCHDISREEGGKRSFHVNGTWTL